MSDEAQGATRRQPAVEPGWQALLDPAMLEARLEEARARREAALARRKAAGEDPATSSLDRAERLRRLDAVLADGAGAVPPPQHVVADPIASPPAEARRPASDSHAAPPPRAVDPLPRSARAPVQRPLADDPRRHASASRTGPAERPGVATDLSGMPDRLKAVILPPAAVQPPAPAVPLPGHAEAGAARRGPWTWLAPALGLILGGAVAFALLWSRPEGDPPADQRTDLATAPVPQTSVPAPATPAQLPTVASKSDVSPGPQPSAPIVAVQTPAAPAEPIGLPPFRAAPAAPLQHVSATPDSQQVPTLGAGPGRLPSVEAATAAAAELAAGPGHVAPRLGFGDLVPPILPVRAALGLPGGAPIAPDLAYDIPAGEDEPAVTTAAREPATTTTRTRTLAPAPAAPAPIVAPPVAEAPASEPAPAPGVRNRLERAVENLLRNRILGE